MTKYKSNPSNLFIFETIEGVIPMVKLLIIADDFTGAFDTGVQFAARGAVTTVVTDPDYDYKSADETVEVLVMVAETRHLTAGEAYDIVYRTAANALQAGIDCIYKKTDSALRGNAGSEIAALMDAAGADSLPLIPAFPKLGRTTKAGIQYIDGVPVAESVFGRDPFEPVLDSAVADILGRKTDVPVVVRSPGDTGTARGIQVYDGETDGELLNIGRTLGKSGLKLSAGCAGFAEVLAEILGLKGEVPVLPRLKKTLFMYCGSVNPVTLAQMKKGDEYGFPHVHLNPVQKLEGSWAESEAAGKCIRRWLETAAEKKQFILDVNDPEGISDTDDYARKHKLGLEDMRLRISDNMALIMKRTLDSGLDATLMCTGGDTLHGFMKRIGVRELRPICEMATGVVLTEFVYKDRHYHIISKSGGFGEPDLLVRLWEKLQGAENK